MPEVRTSAALARNLRTFVDAEEAHLLERHRYGLGGREIARGRADLVDLVVTRASRAIAEVLGPTARDELAACAVLATGAYGRRELSPYSGTEVLLLHPEGLTSAQRALAESLPTLLHDAGVPTGCASHTVAECVELARTDVAARNGLTDARFVTGDGALFHQLGAELHAHVFAEPKANRFWGEEMRAELAERRSRYGAVVGVLEPDLDHGVGGLGDFRLLRWVGLAHWGVRDLDELVAAGLLRAAEQRQALRATDALLRARHEAHLRSGRDTSALSLDLQSQVAEKLGYVDRHFASAAELFMRDLYHRADELHRVSERFLLSTDFWGTPPRRFLLRWQRTIPVGPDRRYRIRDGRLHALSDDEDLGTDPLRLLEVFAVAQRHGVAVSAELRAQLRAKLGLSDRAFRHAPEAADAFMQLLRGRRGVGRTLREMHASGVLDRYMPEFRRITYLVQHDHYHRYTIDEHTLRVVGAVDQLAASSDERLAVLKAALDRVADPGVLVLAALLHDVGKGRGAGPDHAARGARIARRVCRRIGIAEQKLDDVVFLVEKHLVMSRTSQRRDLADEALIEGFAATVGTADRLNMLFVLTYADLSGVAPDSWNEWKSALLHDLYRKALPLVEGDVTAVTASEARASVEDRVLRSLNPEFLRSDVEAFLSHLPARYPRAVPPDLIAVHFEVHREEGNDALSIRWRSARKGPYTLLSVCAPDERGLLARMAGALTSSGIDILSLDVFTHDDGLALDVFRVSQSGGRVPRPVTPALRARATETLKAALRGVFDPAEVVAKGATHGPRRGRGGPSTPPEVRFERDPRGRTLIEVRADDEPGVLFRIASTLFTLGLDISAAKVATEKHQALDIFYVEEVGRRPVPEARHAEIRSALLEALGGEPPARAKVG